MDFDKRKDLVDASVQRRIIDQNRSSGDVPRSFLVFTCLLIPVSVFAGGFITYQMYIMDSDTYLEETSVDKNLSYNIDGYEIRFVSPEMNQDMEGNWGYTYLKNDIFINKKLLDHGNFEQIRNTCEHELLHNLGVPEKHHDFIDIFERQVESPVCDKLMYRIG